MKTITVLELYRFTAARLYASAPENQSAGKALANINPVVTVALFDIENRSRPEIRLPLNGGKLLVIKFRVA